MSLYVCICKGDYDALLLWPFNHKIVVTLLDQSKNENEQRPIPYVIKPNTCKENLAFLGRPVSERNASFGAQKFVELEVLNSFDYIVDDSIFIKVEINLDN
jgi:TNF receptor-associated factor 4